ncbi:Fur family transcriptional regulator [Acinetobacter puyangensis]|uniref:Fur family transcriptional regulator n=1 Tax=Acinetobacter puyangensis TaxID=1096779 RepID=UPI003A4D86D0
MQDRQEFNEIRDTLRQAKIKVTHARLVIYRILKHAKHELTAYDIENISLKMNDRINIGTIYSSLKLFQTAGLLQRYKVDMEQALFSLKQFDHYSRFICNHCGAIETFEDSEIDQRLKTLCENKQVAYVASSLIINIESCEKCKGENDKNVS